MHLFFKKTWIILIGFIISVFLIYFSFQKLDWEELTQVFFRIKFFPYVIFSALAYLLGHVARGIRLYYLVSNQCSLSVFTATNIVVFGYAFNNVFPARLGELARIGMLHQMTGMPLAQSATITFLERLLDGLTILSLFVFSSWMLGITSWVGNGIFLLSIFLILGFVFVLCALLFPNQLIRIVLYCTTGMGIKMQNFLLKITSSITDGVSYLRSFKNACRIILWSIIVWLIEACTFFFLFPAFEMNLTLLSALFVMSIVNLGILIPSTPGYIGTFQFFTIQALVLLGISREKALDFSLLTHVVIYIPLTIWGFAILYWYGIQLKETFQFMDRAKTAKKKENIDGIEVKVLATYSSPSKKDHVSSFLHSLVETLLHSHMGKIKEEEKQNIVNAISHRIFIQLQELPLQYFILHQLGMWGFRFLVFLSTLRSFRSLPIDLREKILSSYMYGKVGIFRKLFRLTRSSTLLIYFDSFEGKV